MTAKAERLAGLVICAGMAVATAANLSASAPAAAPAAPEPAVSTRSVYFDGRPVELAFARVRHSKAFQFGPWELDAHISHDKPRDPHPNLYIVAPGDQYTSDQAPTFNHSEIISTIPVKVEAREWDLYWAIVLDPALQEMFHSERQLLLAAQNGFKPQPDFDVDSMPGITFLRDFLHVKTVDDLDRFRRPDGTLPQVIIVPAGVSIKATAVDPEIPPEEGKSTLSRAISAILRGHDQKRSAENGAGAPPK